MSLSVHTMDMIFVRVSAGVSVHQHLVIWILGGLLIIVPGTFKVQGLIDFFRTAPRQKPYFTQVRYMLHCDTDP